MGKGYFFHSEGGNGNPKRVSDLLKLTQPMNAWQVSLLLVSLSFEYFLLPFQEFSPDATGSCCQGAGLQTRQVSRHTPPPILSMEIK